MQILKYKWTDFSTTPSPHIMVSSEMGMQKMQLLGRKISLKIGKKKCIGSFVKGNHNPCTNYLETNDSFCGSCAIADDYNMCIRCTGDKCINEKQRNSCKKNSYFIYLAAFDNVLKVGISLDRRIMERLIEQGADMGAKIAKIQDGMKVRQVEQQVKNYLGVVDRLRGNQKQRLIFGSPNTAAININNAIAKLRTNGLSEHIMYQPEIFDLRKYYHLDKVPYNPRPIQLTEGHLEGTCIAAKGNVLIFSSDVQKSLFTAAGYSDIFSINAHDLVGREVIITN